MSREQPTVKLPVERIDQLRQIASKLGLSHADVIGHFIRKEIAAGTIKPDLPGILVEGTATGVTLGFGGQNASLSPTQAAAVADKITSLANGSGLGGSMRAFVEAQAPSLGLREPDPVRVERRGTGLRVTINDVTRAFALDVARDLANLLRNAAAANK